MTTSDLIRSVSDDIHDLGPAFYFTPETADVGKAHGLDAFRFYVLGRGGVLGDVEWPVVASAFGYWHPGLLQKMWDTGRERADLRPRECARLYAECGADFGRARYADVPGLQAFCDAADRVIAAADPAGLALFSGYVAEPLVDDLPGRAAQQLVVLREHTGSAHLLAVIAVGMSPKIAHGVRRPEGWEMFGYRDEAPPEQTPERLEQLAEADRLTQALITPAYSVLSGAELEAMQQTLTALTVARG